MTTDTRPRKGKKRAKDSPMIWQAYPTPFHSLTLVAHTRVDAADADTLRALAVVEAYCRSVRGLVMGKRIK